MLFLRLRRMFLKLMDGTDSPDIEDLKRLSDEDLRFRYAEGLTQSMVETSKESGPN